jgi:hypothetical protein
MDGALQPALNRVEPSTLNFTYGASRKNEAQLSVAVQSFPLPSGRVAHFRGRSVTFSFTIGDAVGVHAALEIGMDVNAADPHPRLQSCRRTFPSRAFLIVTPSMRMSSQSWSTKRYFWTAPVR